MESLGARLKRERERQNMTLDQVATATKIGTRMLKALEDEHFDQLPGGIFNKGFVRAYARHLSLDEDQAIADYLAATGASQPIKEPEAVLAALATRAEESSAAEKPGGDDGLPWDKLAALLLLVALGFALWGSAQPQEESCRHRPAWQHADSCCRDSRFIACLATALIRRWNSRRVGVANPDPCYDRALACGLGENFSLADPGP